MNVGDIVWLAACAAIPGIFIGRLLASMQRVPVRVRRRVR